MLKKHLLPGEERLQDLEETALRFEESIFTTATSQVYILHGSLEFAAYWPDFIFMYFSNTPTCLLKSFAVTIYLFPLFCSQII